MHGYRDDELAARWVQFGCFSPILRLHSSDSRWTSKEPWSYREESARVMSKFLQLRHRLVPYTYSMNVVCESSDEPLVQPMYWKYPLCDEAYSYPNQYSFGSSLLVAPVVSPRTTATNRAKVKIWVPPLRHVDIFTGNVYDGDRELNCYRTIESIPVLAPEGAIIPFDAESVPANGCSNPNALEVFIVVGRSGFFRIVENSRDDIDSSTRSEDDRCIDIQFDQSTGRLSTTASGRRWVFRFIGVLHVPAGMKVLVDNTELAEASISVDSGPRSPGLVVEVPLLPSKNDIIIELEPSPQLSKVDYVAKIHDIILDMQAEYSIKEHVWAIVNGVGPEVAKVGQLLSLDLEEAIIGPILEFILADSRSGNESLINGGDSSVPTNGTT